MNDQQISAALNNLRNDARREAGHPIEDRCPTCGRPAAAPARRLVDGEIVEGCVDAHHTGALPAGSATAAWHDQPFAQRLRARALASMPEPASVEECLRLMGM